MISRLAGAVFAGAMGVLMTSGPCVASEPLSLVVGSPVTGTFEAGADTARFLFGAAVGDYVQGRVQSDETPIDLDLLDNNGQPVRRLLSSSTGLGEFRFMALSDGSLLRLTGQGGSGGNFTLLISQKLALVDQKTPQPTFQSAIISKTVKDLNAGQSTDAFWSMVAAKGSPLIEPLGDQSSGAGQSLLTFVARGAKRNVRLFGAPSGDHEHLQRLGSSDIWFKSFVVPNSTRLSYKIAPDVPDIPGSAREQRVAILATAQADPFNHQPWPADASDRFNQDSTVQLSEAPAQPGLVEKAVPNGTLATSRFSSKVLGNTRDIMLYKPSGFDPADPDTVLLFVFDADAYLSKVPTPIILDNLIAEKRLPPVVAVFVANPDRQARSRELPGNLDFAAFMAEELLPWVAGETGFSQRPERTVLAGSSYGGLASATVAMAYPNSFGNVLALSGSFWWHPDLSDPRNSEYVAGYLAKAGKLPIRFFLSVGQFEMGRAGVGGILETGRHLRDVLRAKDYDVTYREYAAGHDYFAWRGILADGLISLFGTAD
jgi:enterochelin esterase-like enzyme